MTASLPATYTGKNGGPKVHSDSRFAGQQMAFRMSLSRVANEPRARRQAGLGDQLNGGWRGGNGADIQSLPDSGCPQNRFYGLGLPLGLWDLLFDWEAPAVL